MPPHLRIIVAIEYTGVGVSAEDQERIFKSFAQVSAYPSRKGVGLGLAIQRTIVELMHGKITIQSIPGQGSAFQFVIPVDQVSEVDVIGVEIRRNRVLQREWTISSGN